jgi:hypothetical protein
MWPEPAHDDTIPPEGSVSLTLRLPPALHAALKEVSATRHRSLNSLIVDAVQHAMTPPGGTAQIAAARRRMTLAGRRGRAEQARAAVAYVLGYLGRRADARREWPWLGRFAVEKADTASLAMAGALLAAEIDRVQKDEGT